MNNLKQLRKKKGFSQLQLAAFLHTSPSTVALWELGQKSAELGQLLMLCRVLECSPCDLFLPPCDEDDGCFDLPLFSADVQPAVSFVRLSCGHPLSVCHFGAVIPHSLSSRIQQGDICYFEMCSNCADGDVVICLDCDSNATICIAGSSDVTGRSIVAVSRFLQSRF